MNTKRILLSPQSSVLSPRRRLGEALGVPAAFAGLTVGMTWPLAAEITNLTDGGDGWQFLWNLWWMKTALVDLHTNPYYTDYLYHPFGTNLYLDALTPLLGVVSVPLQVLGLPLVGIYNLLVLASFVLAGYGMYLLARDLTGHRPAAFVAGLIFAFCPYHFAHTLGHLNLLSLQWLPFYLVALFKMWGLGAGGQGPGAGDQGSGMGLENTQHATRNTQSPTPNFQPPTLTTQSSVLSPQHCAWAGAAGGWLAVTAYTEWTYALFLGLFTAWFVAWQTLVVRRGPGWRAGAARLGIAGSVALVLVAPVLLPMIAEARSTSYGQHSIQDAVFLSSDLTDIVTPSTFHPLVRETIGPALATHLATRSRAERIAFAGYSVLGVSLAAAWLLRRRRAVLFWGVTALGAWILSLGPILHVWGERFFLGTQVPLPYLGLYVIPFFNILRVPARFNVLLMLALAVLVAYALAAVARGQGRGLPAVLRRGGGAAILGALVLFEYLAAPFPMMPLNYDQPFYHELARDPRPVAVLNLPLIPFPIHMAQQIVHRHPMIGGYLSRQPPDTFAGNTAVMRYLLPGTPVDDPLAAEAARTGLADLRQARVGYVTVHWWLVAGPAEADLRAKLARVFPGVPTREIAEPQTTVFLLLPP